MASGTRSGTAPKRAGVGGGYRPQLDALRFFAIAGVLVAHNLDPGQAPWIFSRFDYAETGVRLFFVLSGFLITGILLGEREAADAAPHRRISAIRRFYARRFLRIFPIYYLTLAVVLVTAVSPARQIWPWLFTYTTNIYAWHHLDWPGPVGHLWTLAVEEQFYLVWPWFLLFVPRKWILPFLVGLIALAPLYRLFASFHYSADASDEFTSGALTIAVVDSLALGALLAVVTRAVPRARLSRLLKQAVLLPGAVIYLAVLFLAHYGIDDHAFVALGQTGEALICGWVVVTAAFGFRGAFGRVLEFRPITYLGKISYGIYIFHLLVPVAVGAAIRHSGHNYQYRSYAFFTLTTIVTFGLAAVSWHFFEAPINRLKRFFPYDSAPKRGSPAPTPTAAPQSRPGTLSSVPATSDPLFDDR